MTTRQRIREAPVCQRAHPVEAHAQKDRRNNFTTCPGVVPGPDGVPPNNLARYATRHSICGFTQNEYHGFRSIAANKLPGSSQAYSVCVDLCDRHWPDV